MNRKHESVVGKQTGWLALCAVVLGLTPAAQAAYDVLASDEGAKELHRYTVSENGQTWTKAANPFLTGTIARQVAAIGDGYIYVVTNNVVSCYKPDGTLEKVWKTGGGVSGHYRIVASPDRVWFYLGKDWNAAADVCRFRISDPNIGGSLKLHDAAHGGVNWTRNRHIVLGRDGLLYFGARGEITTGNGETDPQRGVFVYDPTVANVPRVGRYAVVGVTAGVAVCVDDDRDCLYAMPKSGEIQTFYRGRFDSVQSIAAGAGTVFFGVDLGGTAGMLFGSYDNKDGPNDGVIKFDKVQQTVKKINIDWGTVCALSDVTAASKTGTQLPFINGVWYMNEASAATTVINGAQPGKWDLALKGDLKAGQLGASRGGLFSQNGGYGEISDSKTLVPATEDFTIGLWVYAPTGTSRTLFSNGEAALTMDQSGRASFTAGGVTVKGAESLWNAWYWLVVRRHADTLELWVNNNLKASGELAGTTAIGQTSNWRLGANPDGTEANGAVFFDELRVYPKLLPTDDLTHLYNLVQPEAKKPLGSEISLVEKDGVLYTAFNGAAYRSANQGETWEKKGTIALEAASLFVANGVVYAVGRNGDGMLALSAATDEGASWSSPVTIGEGVPVPALRASRPVLANGRVYLGMASSSLYDLGTVSFAFSNGTASDPKVGFARVPPHLSNLQQTHAYYTSVSAVAWTNASQTVYALGTSMLRENNLGETLTLAKNSETGSSYAGTLGFSGASKPLSIIWDETTRCYWLVTAACHNKDISASKSRYDQATSLALYSSPDLYKWWYHADVTVQGVSFYAYPSVAVAGGNLVVTFLDSYFAASFKTAKFENFRRYWNNLTARDKGYHAQELFVPVEVDNWVYKYWHDETTDNWLPAGLFCQSGTAKNVNGTEQPFADPYSIWLDGDHVFVVWKSTKAPNEAAIGEYTKDGVLLKLYPTPFPADGFCVSLDGKKFFITRWWGNELGIFDRETGTWETRDFGSAFTVSRGVADLGDGRVAISSRAACAVLLYDLSSGTYETLKDGLWVDGTSTTDGPMDLKYEPETHRLWMNGSSMGLGYYDVEKKTYTTVSKEATRLYHGYTFWKDTILCSLYTPSRLVSITPEEGKNTLSRGAILLSVGVGVNRPMMVEMPQVEIATVILFR